MLSTLFTLVFGILLGAVVGVGGVSFVLIQVLKISPARISLAQQFSSTLAPRARDTRRPAHVDAAAANGSTPETAGSRAVKEGWLLARSHIRWKHRFAMVADGKMQLHGDDASQSTLIPLAGVTLKEGARSTLQLISINSSTIVRLRFRSDIERAEWVEVIEASTSSAQGGASAAGSPDQSTESAEWINGLMPFLWVELQEPYITSEILRVLDSSVLSLGAIPMVEDIHVTDFTVGDAVPYLTNITLGPDEADLRSNHLTAGLVYEGGVNLSVRCTIKNINVPVGLIVGLEYVSLRISLVMSTLDRPVSVSLAEAPRFVIYVDNVVGDHASSGHLNTLLKDQLETRLAAALVDFTEPHRMWLYLPLRGRPFKISSEPPTQAGAELARPSVRTGKDLRARLASKIRQKVSGRKKSGPSGDGKKKGKGKGSRDDDDDVGAGVRGGVFGRSRAERYKAPFKALFNGNRGILPVSPRTVASVLPLMAPELPFLATGPTLLHRLVDAAAHNSKAPLLRFKDSATSAEWRVWSVGQVARYVLAAAKEVRRIAKETDLAIAPGDHAVVWPSAHSLTPHYLIMVLALQLLGCVVVIMDPAYVANQAASVVRALKPKVLVAVEGRLRLFESTSVRNVPGGMGRQYSGAIRSVRQSSASIGAGDGSASLHFSSDLSESEDGRSSLAPPPRRGGARRVPQSGGDYSERAKGLGAKRKAKPRRASIADFSPLTGADADLPPMVLINMSGGELGVYCNSLLANASADDVADKITRVLDRKAVGAGDKALILFGSSHGHSKLGLVRTHQSILACGDSCGQVLFRNHDTLPANLFTYLLPLKHLLISVFPAALTHGVELILGSGHTSLKRTLGEVAAEVMVVTPYILQGQTTDVYAAVQALSFIKRKRAKHALRAGKKDLIKNSRKAGDAFSDHRSSTLAGIRRDLFGPTLTTIYVGFVERCVLDTLVLFHSLGFALYEFYGSCAIGIAACNTRGSNALHTGGRALPGNEIKIAEHEVLVRGPAVFSGYALSERLPFTRDGFLRTSDIGLIDTDGRVAILGRGSARIALKSGNVPSPAVLEARLKTSPLIKSLCLHGSTDYDTLVAVIYPDYLLLACGGVGEDAADESAHASELTGAGASTSVAPEAARNNRSRFGLSRLGKKKGKKANKAAGSSDGSDGGGRLAFADVPRPPRDEVHAMLMAELAKIDAQRREVEGDAYDELSAVTRCVVADEDFSTANGLLKSGGRPNRAAIFDLYEYQIRALWRAGDIKLPD